MRTINEIYNTLRRRIIAEFQKINPEATDTQTGAESPLSLALAAEISAANLYLTQILQETSPTTATSERESSVGMLETYGRFFTPPIERAPALGGIFTARFFGTNGSAIAPDLILRTPAGIELQTIASGIIAAGFADVLCATHGIGLDFAVNVGTSVTFSQGVQGVQAGGVIVRVEMQARNEQSTESLRANIIAAFSQTSNGGTLLNYRTWAKQVHGVVTAYPYPALSSKDVPSGAYLGLGFPYVFLEMENQTEEILPESIKAEYLQILTQNAPLGGGQIEIRPCKILKLQVRFAVSVNFNNIPIQDITAAIRAEAVSYLKGRRPFIPAIDTADTSAIRAAEILYLSNVALQNQTVLLQSVSLIISGNDYSEHNLRAGEIAILQDVLLAV